MSAADVTDFSVYIIGTADSLNSMSNDSSSLNVISNQGQIIAASVSLLVPVSPLILVDKC